MNKETAMQCSYCGKEVAGDAKFCSACGAAIGSMRPAKTSVGGAEQQVTTSTKAVIAFVLGLLGFVLWIFASIPAIILGFLARGDIKREPQKISGCGLATAGIVLGIITTVLPVLVFGLGIGFFTHQVATPVNTSVEPDGVEVRVGSQESVD